MNTDDLINELGKLGIKIDKDILNTITPLLTDKKDDAELSTEQVDLLKQIFISKLSDIALTNYRFDVTKTDIGLLERWCVPIIICIKSSILENDKISSVVLTGADVALLESLNIQDNKELVKLDASLLADKAIEHITESSPNLNISDKDHERLEKRISIWKTEAELLSNYQNKSG